MKEPAEKIIPTTCASHCGGTCVLKVHVKDGIITRIETDDGAEPQMRACAKGRAYRQRIYDPDRIKYPMKRMGARGEGKFARISWDEALDTVAGQLKRVKDTCGAASILYIWGSGDMHRLHGSQLYERVLSRFGNITKGWGAYSFQGGIASAKVTYDAWRTANARDDLLNSKLIILWGWNPATTIGGTNTCWFLARAKEAGIKIIVIDPRFTDTVAIFADQWIPIIPGTDAAMLIAMAYVLIEEDLIDKPYLDKYTVGFERFKDYVMGVEDGVAKTPAWAAKITGVPAATIEGLAREYAKARPAALIAGISPGRTAFGEQYHRAASTLSAMTGNVGIHGGDAAGRSWEGSGWYPFRMGMRLTQVDDRPQLYVPSGVHYADYADLMLKGKAGGYPADIKMVFIRGENYVNQALNINKITQALNKMEFIAVVEQVMTATAKYADILLPTTTFLERNDIALGVGTPFYGYVNRLVAPLYESKTTLEIARALAARLGITDLFREDEEEVLKKDVVDTEVTDYDEFKKKGIYKIELGEPHVAFKKQIDDIEHNPFRTPSGKIEIYSQTWAELNDPKCPPVAKYIETWESRNDPLFRKYPLQLITTHFRRRTHTQFEKVPWLRELETQAMLINTRDAQARGIRNGDKVRVFNDRGTLVIPAKVTERIMPGVVDIPQGAWYDPDKNGTDFGGNPNVLTRDKTSPGGAFPYNTCLVQVEKLSEDITS